MRLLKRNGKYRKYQPSIFTISADNDSSCVLLNKMKYDNLLFCKVPDFEDFTKEQYADFCSKYALPSLSERATKVVYASIKNKYFYFTESIFPEQAVVPTCNMALERIKNATVIKNGYEP